MTPRHLSLLPALLVLAGCCAPGRQDRAVVEHAARRSEAPTSSRVESAAAVWVARARAVEPRVTDTLERLAASVGGTLVGVEHRLKSRASTADKIVRSVAKDRGLPPEDVEVYDALRYTLVVDDVPPGRHDAAARDVLAALERDGHRVERVKNYWPSGDSYAGTNCTLRMQDGLPWELQLHTHRSYAAKSSTHGAYERMRDADTPREERRRLFDEMTSVYDALPVPAGVLEEGSLHPVEELILLPRP